ncbi:unnamed protein product [Notodromas monacha]|uniref:PID domain-containing protein n=1 Tax=Notodromas monacha TaxID=399045 RepID=A0A7R9BDD2_9CRUS|nr:unnamed protein product [Notodromas monacha]CAG0913254.1 unnamed protein product [Notodromas monacha]
MDKLRRSFRDSFRKRRDLRSGVRIPEACKPHQWQEDEASVRAGTCSFPVKYLGCIQVYESRGMDICEEALKQLRAGRRRLVKGVLYVSGDGLRVVDDETKGLIVDQTIEKVSFCAPDRNHERGFSYICRDGTTRRWMCHGFLALHDSGERLSHAVGCAFALCLERKQQRDKECTVTMTFDAQGAFTRLGSFRAATLTERIQDPQDLKPVEPPPVKPVVNPYAIERPHATQYMLQRQGSFRGFPQLNSQAPFKRQLSLRLSDLPSTLDRARQIVEEEQAERNQELQQKSAFSDLEQANTPGLLSALAQEVSQGLSLLSGDLDDPFDGFSSKGVSPVENICKDDRKFTSPFSGAASPTNAGIFGAKSPSPAVSTPPRRKDLDPFDAEWAKVAPVIPKLPSEESSDGDRVCSPLSRNVVSPVSTNPFLVDALPTDFSASSPVKTAFEIKM